MVDGTSCGGIEGHEEGIEFAIRNNTNGNIWVPLQLDYYNGIIISNRTIRGFLVSTFGDQSDTTDNIERRVSICGDLLDSDEIQFRWMGRSSEIGETHKDMWALANINATLIQSDESYQLISDGFGCNSINTCTIK